MCASHSIHVGSHHAHTHEVLVAGGIAGALAKTATAPIDRVRILYQVSTRRSFSVRQAVDTTRGIIRHEGAHALWRGNATMMVRVVPYMATQFLVYERVHPRLCSSLGPDRLKSIRFLAGACAGSTAVLVTYPLDLFRARLAYQWGDHVRYTSSIQVARAIIQKEGAANLFKGITPTLLREFPLAGINFSVFETLKMFVSNHQDVHHSEVSTPVRLACGGAAGLIAQSVTYPLDVIRRRMQVANPNSKAPRYRGVAHALQSIAAQEGIVGGLFKGLTMNWIKGPFAVGVRFAAYETMREVMRSRRVQKEALS